MTTRPDDFSFVTDEMFDQELSKQLSAMSAQQLLAVPGAYEVFSEHLNNDILSALEAQRP